MHSFLDYKSLYSSVSQSLLSRLQLVQNSAGQLLIFRCKRDFTPPYWSSSTNCQSLHGFAPSCLCDLLSLHIMSRSPRSAKQMPPTVPRFRLKHRGTNNSSPQDLPNIKPIFYICYLLLIIQNYLNHNQRDKVPLQHVFIVSLHSGVLIIFTVF